MSGALAVAPELIRQEWQQMESWSASRATQEAKRFTRRQPELAAYVCALLEDQGLTAVSVGLELAHTLERAYGRALGGAPVQISERDVEIAAVETDQRFADLVGVEPELAFRQLFFRRDMAAPGVVTELVTLLMETAEDDPELQAALGALFIVTVGTAKAYERAHGLAGDEIPKSSIGEAIEARTGRPLPKVGRNEPCPCGSGRKFKKCCGEWQEPPPPPPKSHAEQLFSDYISAVDSVWSFLHERKRDHDARWVRKRSEDFAARFGCGEPGGAPDSMHVNYTLFDLRIPRCGKTMAEIFLEQEGRRLDSSERARLRHLCDSYPAFYELVEPLPGEGKKRLRELGSGTEWIVNEIEDPHAEMGEPGEIWLCRFVGVREDAVTFMTPLIYQPDTRTSFEELVRALVHRSPAGRLSIAEAIPAAMKQAGEALAEVVIATAPDDADELDEDDSDVDEPD